MSEVQASKFSPINSFNLIATIANGQTTSAVVDVIGNCLCGVFIPSAFTGTTISLQASNLSTGTFYPVNDGAGSTVSLTVVAGEYTRIDPIITAGIRYLKIVSGSAEAAEREIILATRPV